MSSADAVIEFIDDHREDLIRLLTRLVEFRTDSQTEGNTEFAGEARRCHAFLAAELHDIGVEVREDAGGAAYPVTIGYLAGTGNGRSIALNGHIDVVPAGDRGGWTADPWTVDERAGRLYGRGTADMKGGVASLLFAVRALRACRIEVPGDIWVHLVSDEEVVGSSTRDLLRRLPLPDAVIDAEPTGLRLMPVEGGLIHLRIEVQGQETHAGNRYTLIYPGAGAKGVSAIDKAITILLALQDLERQWAHKPVHPFLPPGFNTILPGVIMGGPGGGRSGRLNVISNPGTVPDYCSIEYNIWYMPYETFDGVRDEIEQYLRRVCENDPWLAAHPPRLTWKLNNIFFPPVNTPPDHPVITALAHALRRTGAEPAVTGFTAASELAWYAERGVPGVLFGPGEIAQAHSPDEFVPREDLIGAAKVVALALPAFAAAPAGERS
jgi:acetylornithine deacetylase/succinyl-diaminopimelate desuccinylase family protein